MDAQINAICARSGRALQPEALEIAREYASRALEIAQVAGSELGGASAELVLGLDVFWSDGGG